MRRKLQKDSFFVDDGPFDYFIQGVPGMYPDVYLTVQPCTKTEQSNWAKASARMDSLGNADGLKKYESEFIAARTKSWSLPRPPMAENIALLAPRLYTRILGIVVSDDSGDPMPPDESDDTAAVGTVQLQEST